MTLTRGAAGPAGRATAVLDGFVTTLHAAVADNRGLSRSENAHARNRGQQAAETGLALAAIIDAHLEAATQWWLAEPDRPADSVSTLLQAIKETLSALADGYQRARRAAVREQVAVRREFADDLLSGQGNPIELMDRAEAFGVSLRQLNAVAVIATERPLREASAQFTSFERGIRGPVSLAGSGGEGAPDTLDAFVVTKSDRIVIVFATDTRTGPATGIGSRHGAGSHQGKGDLAGLLVARVARLLGRGEDGVSLTRRIDLGRWRLGLGRPALGAHGIHTSYDEAIDALTLADQLGLRQRVLQANDLLVYQVLLRDRAAIIDLVHTVLTPLRDARGGAEPLLTTLRAYFDAGTNSALAARHLHLSVRAVRYRLERVHRLCGYDPDDPEQRFTLHTAVRGAQLLDWPHDPSFDEAAGRRAT